MSAFRMPILHFTYYVIWGSEFIATSINSNPLLSIVFPHCLVLNSLQVPSISHLFPSAVLRMNICLSRIEGHYPGNNTSNSTTTNVKMGTTLNSTVFLCSSAYPSPVLPTTCHSLENPPNEKGSFLVGRFLLFETTS